MEPGIDSTDLGMGIAALIIALIIGLVISVLIIASCWKIFTKAGKPGWACLVPFYSTWVLVEICGKPTWWFWVATFAFPVNFIFMIMLVFSLAQVFGKGGGFGVGLLLFSPIFLPMLGFGSAEYKGAPAAA